MWLVAMPLQRRSATFNVENRESAHHTHHGCNLDPFELMWSICGDLGRR